MALDTSADQSLSHFVSNSLASCARLPIDPGRDATRALSKYLHRDSNKRHVIRTMMCLESTLNHLAHLSQAVPSNLPGTLLNLGGTISDAP